MAQGPRNPRHWLAGHVPPMPAQVKPRPRPLPPPAYHGIPAAETPEQAEARQVAEARQDWNVGTAILPGKGWLITPWAPGDPVPEGARVIPGPVVICDA